MTTPAPVVPGPVVLLVLDGFGVRADRADNAWALARTPNFDAWAERYPHTTLAASELRVGLPDGQMGNSEVGHLNLGAGRVVYLESTRITLAVRRGTLAENAPITEAMDRVRVVGALHLLGLVSDGGVHSYQEHLEGLLRLARERGTTRVFVHAFLDGRDTPPASGAGYLEKLQAFLREQRLGRIAVVAGRYYAMDRDKRWERVAKAWRAMVLGEGVPAEDPVEAVRRSYEQGVTDEFVVPVVVQDGGQPVARVRDGDSAIFFNFRADRARQLTAALTQPAFDGFPRSSAPRPHFVCMTEYDPKLRLPVAFPPVPLRNIMADALAAASLPNLRIAETEKYAHVTYFFNGGVERPWPGEDRILIPSAKVATYDLRPEMSAFEITGALLDQLALARHRVVIGNFANPDMVGHTGVLPAAIRAVEVVDECVARIVEDVLSRRGAVVITADHGNCEQMRDPVTGQPHTAHTLFPVPFYLIHEGASGPLREGGALEDVAPTLLRLLGLPKPEEMTGRDLREVP
ncbi:MAG TPA: 2,3-bisphosphoglycerate-independent phosphoglycerate mutase [Vicinamibacteria bacterium]|nr:2,3-bisphosphoglycerate-independent phosphoglycerate mutase [Vicinamibacteria bacterium]